MRVLAILLTLMGAALLAPGEALAAAEGRPKGSVRFLSDSQVGGFAFGPATPPTNYAGAMYVGGGIAGPCTVINKRLPGTDHEFLTADDTQLVIAGATTGGVCGTTQLANVTASGHPASDVLFREVGSEQGFANFSHAANSLYFAYSSSGGNRDAIYRLDLTAATIHRVLTPSSTYVLIKGVAAKSDTIVYFASELAHGGTGDRVYKAEQLTIPSQGVPEPATRCGNWLDDDDDGAGGVVADGVVDDGCPWTISPAAGCTTGKPGCPAESCPNDVDPLSTCVPQPTGLALAPNGDLYILQNNGFVRRAQFPPPAQVPPEAGTQCANYTDDDSDTVVNDGCPSKIYGVDGQLNGSGQGLAVDARTLDLVGGKELSCGVPSCSQPVALLHAPTGGSTYYGWVYGGRAQSGVTCANATVAEDIASIAGLAPVHVAIDKQGNIYVGLGDSTSGGAVDLCRIERCPNVDGNGVVNATDLARLTQVKDGTYTPLNPDVFDPSLDTTSAPQWTAVTTQRDIDIAVAYFNVRCHATLP